MRPTVFFVSDKVSSCRPARSGGTQRRRLPLSLSSRTTSFFLGSHFELVSQVSRWLSRQDLLFEEEEDRAVVTHFRGALGSLPVVVRKSHVAQRPRDTCVKTKLDAHA